MSLETNKGKALLWTTLVEKFEEIVVAVLALLLVVIIGVILAVVISLFASKLWAVSTSIDNIAELQKTALRSFSGILLVLLGLELLDTVKVYFREHTMRVEVILLVGLIAMGRHVLEIDLHHIEPLILFGFSGLLLALAVSYYLVKRSQFSVINFKEHGREDGGEILGEK
jgi:uncharacterized membrane protein (DUF373 family)